MVGGVGWGVGSPGQGNRMTFQPSALLGVVHNPCCTMHALQLAHPARPRRPAAEIRGCPRLQAERGDRGGRVVGWGAGLRGRWGGPWPSPGGFSASNPAASRPRPQLEPETCHDGGELLGAAAAAAGGPVVVGAPSELPGGAGPGPASPAAGGGGGGGGGGPCRRRGSRRRPSGPRRPPRPGWRQGTRCPRRTGCRWRRRWCNRSTSRCRRSCPRCSRWCRSRRWCG